MANRKSSKPSMRVIKSGKNRTKTSNSSFNPILFILLIIPWLAWQVIKFVYLLLIGIPNAECKFLGFIRTIVWGMVMYFVYKMGMPADTDKVGQWELLGYILAPIGTLIFLVLSILIMFGFHSELQVDDAEPYYPNIEATMGLIDFNLSSYKTRNDFIKTFLNIKR